MPVPQKRYDRYGRPLPSIVETCESSRTDSSANLGQRDRLRHLLATLETRYPELLRPDVHADILVSFKVVGGTIQDEWHVRIEHVYRKQAD
jgi:hypothetical protein